MTNDIHHSYCPRIKMPLAVLVLLPLLLAFLSSVTHHQVAETRLNHGFVSTLNHLAVASNSESLRAQSSASEKYASADTGPDTSYWWHENPTVFETGSRLTDSLAHVGLDATPSAIRYRNPLLRAPPSA